MIFSKNMQNKRTNMLLFVLLLAGSYLVADIATANNARIYNLSADLWSRPRSGGIIPQIEPVRLAVTYWESVSDAVLLLSYPGEDSGEIWAAELKDWLVSLGVPSDNIVLSPGLHAEDEIQIMVGNRTELLR